MGQPIGYMVGRDCDILTDLSAYETASSSDLDRQFHIDSVRENFRKDRKYMEIPVGMSDSHIEIEKLGVCKHQKAYSVILSMEDSLDYLLHRLTGARLDNIRNVPDYKQISRALLKLNYPALGDKNIGVFRDCDEKIDEYFEKLFIEAKGDTPNEKVDNVQSEFFMSVLKELKWVLDYTTFHYFLTKKNSPEFASKSGGLVLRSRSFCSFVMTSDVKLEDELILRCEGNDDYRLQVRSFERNEYFESMSLSYA